MKKISVLSVLLIFLSSFAFAGTVNLPRTGQTQCYDTSGTPIPCAGTGQDGEIQAGVAWPEPRFTDNGDGTVTDNLTGLMWTKDASLTYVYFYQALDYMKGMNAGTYSNFGHTDWRLPNVNELESLTNANEANSPTGFTNMGAWSYWSSTGGYAVGIWDGRVDTPAGSPGCVWPVRAGQSGNVDITYPANVWKTGQTTSNYSGDDGDLQKGVAWPNPRFVDNGDGTVTDRLTGLMWTKNANLGTDVYPQGKMAWQQALDYVARMNAGTYENLGYKNWRLPNRKELHSLTDFSRGNPALPAGHPFTNVQTSLNESLCMYAGLYWSSTPISTNTFPFSAGEWQVSMMDCSVNSGNKDSEEPSCYYGYVWPVRAGQAGELGDSDISVTKTEFPDPVTVGYNQMTYTIVVTNNGPVTATGVFLTDTLPTSVTYVSSTSTKGWSISSGSIVAYNTVTYSIGTLTNGASATVTIIVTPMTAGTITNTASATCNETDTNFSNNTATATTTVNAFSESCSTWDDVISKYQAYVSGQASWTDVITCYTQYTSS